MILTTPILLWIGTGIALLTVVGVSAHGRRRRALARFLGSAGRRHSGLDPSRFPWVRASLLVLAVLGAALAAAEPRRLGPPAEPPPPDESRSVVFAIDVSASMQATDLSPTRLGRAVEVAGRILDDLDQEYVGIVLFAGTGYPLAPPTQDHGALRFLLSGVAPTIASAHDPGTLLSTAIDAAVTLLDDHPDAGGERFIVLLADGEAGDDEGSVETSARAAAERGVRIHAVGVGTEEGGGVVMPAAPYQLGGIVIDEARRPVVSRLRASSLDRIAEIGGGSYTSVEDEAGLRALAEALGRPGSRDGVDTPEEEAGLDATRWLTAAALVFLLFESLADVRFRGHVERRSRGDR